MKEPKSINRMREFSITNFFLVTGISFLAFTGAMKLLDGVTIRILLRIGLFSLGFGAFALIIKWLFNKWNERHPRLQSQENQIF